MRVGKRLGRGHPTVRRLRELRRERAARDREGVFVAEGVHLAEEALASRAPIEVALVSPALERLPGGGDLRRRLDEAGIDVREVAEALLDSLQDARSPQPVLVVVRRTEFPVEDLLTSGDPPALVVVTVGLQDPGNLGSIIRTADAAGATGLVVTGRGVDRFHPRTVRASMGSIFRLPTAEASVDDVIRRASRAGISLVASDPSARETYHSASLDGPVALLVGSEAAGIPPRLAAAARRRVRIPMAPGVDSLSVGAAAAVVLFEASRQRALRVRLPRDGG